MKDRTLPENIMYVLNPKFAARDRKPATYGLQLACSYIGD